jgi:hypothetical protein
LKDDRRVFPKLLALGMGATVDFSLDDQIALGVFAQELGNSEIDSTVINSIEDEMSAETIIDRVSTRVGLHLDTSREIAFLAGNFHCLPAAVRDSLSLGFLCEVLEHEGLRIQGRL